MSKFVLNITCVIPESTGTPCACDEIQQTNFDGRLVFDKVMWLSRGAARRDFPRQSVGDISTALPQDHCTSDPIDLPGVSIL